MIKHGQIPVWYDKDSEFEEVFHKDTMGTCALWMSEILMLLSRYLMRLVILPKQIFQKPHVRN